jgi:hypothetical protein
MKKITCFTIASFALGSFSLRANAAETSVHSGTVTPTCSLVVVNGSLPLDETLTPNLTTNNSSADAGKISTVCNRAGSTLKVELTTGSFPPQPNITQHFLLSNGTGAYASGLPTTFAATTYNKTNLTNSYLSSTSDIRVRARIFVPNTQNLAAGSYTVNILATVTP